MFPADSPWPSSGYHLLNRADPRQLLLSDDWLRHLWQRPDLAPVEESCPAERRLHESLLATPRRPVSTTELQQLADPDATESYGVALALRHLLMARQSFEEAYLELIGGNRTVSLPGASQDLLAQLLIRHILADCHDPQTFRAAELFFRNQLVSLEHGIQLADALTLARLRPLEFTPLQQLIHKVANGATRQVPLEVLGESNQRSYWEQAEAHNLVLDLSLEGPGMLGLCRVLAAWVDHFCGSVSGVTALREIDDPKWSWHIGLDAESTALLNTLYRGEEPSAAKRASLLTLFRLDFDATAPLKSELRSRPIYLGLAMDKNRLVAMKPQNLLLNLPLVLRPTDNCVFSEP